MPKNQLKKCLTRQEDRASGCCGPRWQASFVNKGAGGDAGQSGNVENLSIEQIYPYGIWAKDKRTTLLTNH